MEYRTIYPSNTIIRYGPCDERSIIFSINGRKRVRDNNSNIINCHRKSHNLTDPSSIATANVETREHIAKIMNAATACTRRRGAGVRSFPNVAEKDFESPLRSLICHLADFKLSVGNHPDSMRKSALEHSHIKLEYYSPRMTTESERIPYNKSVNSINFQFSNFSRIERVIGAIYRLLDDRAAIMRRGGDDPIANPTTHIGASLLIQEIYDAMENIQQLLSSLSSSSVRMELSVGLESNCKLHGMINTNNFEQSRRLVVTGDRGFCAQSYIPHFTAIHMYIHLARRLRFLADDDLGLSQLKRRVEAGLSIWINNSLEITSAKCLKKNTFMQSLGASKRRGSGPFRGTNEGTVPEPSSIADELCTTLLTPYLDILLCHCRPPVQHQLLTLILNGALESMLESILKRKLRFNEPGVGLLHAQLDRLLKWIAAAKQQLKIPPACPLIQDTKPWTRVNALLQILLSACNGALPDANAPVNKPLGGGLYTSKDGPGGGSRPVSRSGMASRDRAVSNNHSRFSSALGDSSSSAAVVASISKKERDEWAALAVMGESESSCCCFIVLPMRPIVGGLKRMRGKRPVFVALKLNLAQL